MPTTPLPGTVVQVGSQVSPSGDTGIGGPAGPAPNQGIVIGGTVAEPNFPGGIIVPTYKNHPDAIWTPMNAFDDHFDGASLDPKWTPANSAGMLFLLTELVNSHLQFGGSGAADNATQYAYNFTANLPTPIAQSFTITFCVKADLFVFGATTQSSTFSQVQLQIYNASTSGLRVSYTLQYVVAQQSARPYITDGFGAGFGSAGNVWYTNALPRYWRLKYNQADQSIAWFFSETGQSNWTGLGSRTGAQTGFSTTPPSLLTFGLQVLGLSRGNIQVDWIRYTTP